VKHSSVGLLIALLGLLGPLGTASATQSALSEPAVQVDSGYGCLICHADKRRTFGVGVHSERGIRCHDCHGGNPASVETARAWRSNR